MQEAGRECVHLLAPTCGSEADILASKHGALKAEDKHDGYQELKREPGLVPSRGQDPPRADGQPGGGGGGGRGTHTSAPSLRPHIPGASRAFTQIYTAVGTDAVGVPTTRGAQLAAWWLSGSPVWSALLLHLPLKMLRRVFNY